MEDVCGTRVAAPFSDGNADGGSRFGAAKRQRKSLGNRTLRIPSKHADAWLSALNQARLVIAAKNNFTESELNDHFRSPIGSRRDLSLFQVNFYGFLQEFILREMWSD